MSSVAVRQRTDDAAPIADAPPSSAARDALAHALHVGAHMLPAQGPIETFIHHNTLHAFEHLPFHDALAAAARLTGATSYLPEDEFRRAFASGRIADRDLDAAIAQRPRLVGDDGPDALAPRASILRACLLEDLAPEPAARIRWRFSEDRALAGPGDDLRWAACQDVARRLGRAETTALHERATRVLDSIGERSHRDVALSLTGVDVGVAVDRWMVRDVASHLDEGLATDSHRQPGVGLFARWRSCTRPGRRYLSGLPRGFALPADPGDAAVVALSALGVPAVLYDAYITRVLQHLPGWAGMIHWRETHPEYRPDLPPVSLVEFVAIRLLGELSELRRLTLSTWGCEPDRMMAHLRAHGDEAALRVALFGGSLHGPLARRARALLLRPHDGRSAGAAAILHAAIDDDEDRALTCAWQLHRVTRALCIGGDELRCTPLPRIAAVLDAVDAFDPEIRLPIWQDAYELGYRDQILEALHDNRGHAAPPPPRPTFQIVTCIDDREEGLRRHLEAADPGCESFGTGGFFGIPIAFRGRDDDGFSALCPLGVTPMHRVLEVPCPTGLARSRRYDVGQRTLRRWRGHWRQILGHGWASLVGAYAAGFFAWFWLIGELVFPRQFERVRRPLRRLVMPEHPSVLVTDEPGDGGEHTRAGFSLREQVERVRTTLQNIGLVDGFSRLVVVLAHGSHSVNNPHLSAYDCGACGGRHGGPNARLFAQMANAPAVRAGLRTGGIDIPDDTWFLGGEHDTCNEDVRWFDAETMPRDHAADFAALGQAMDRARRMSAHERCRRFEHAPQPCDPDAALRHVQARALDPSQVRPELNHATNAAAVFGRRALTRGVFFDRRTFLVSYDPATDVEGRVLERLLLALAPVGAGINLEYYFSRVDPSRYGAGTKLPHNVVGLIGVMDGWSSDLRCGLPRQMTEIHEPLRLQLVLEARAATVAAILARQPQHSQLRRLVEHAWVHVTLVDPEDGSASVFVPGGELRAWHPRGHVLPVVSDWAAWYADKTDALPPARIEADAIAANGAHHGH